MDGDHDPPDDESLADALSRLSALSNLESFTARELIFLGYFLSAGGRHGDGIASAVRAGFTGSRRTLAVTASRIMRKAYQGGLLRVLLEQHGAGLPEACKAVAGVWQFPTT